jgi:hypothetical protein
MSKPLVVSIPHRLGKEEAVRRLKSGLAKASVHFAAVMRVVEETWSGDRMTFRVVVLGQAASGVIVVYDDRVVLEVQLPWMLAQVARRVMSLIEKQGHLMLDRK